MKVLSTILLSVLCFTAVSQSIRKTKDQSFTWGDSYLVRSCYLKQETENGARDLRGNPVKVYYEPAEVEMKTVLRVELTQEKNGLYDIHHKDIFIDPVSEPRYSSGILHSNGTKNIRFHEIKEIKDNPRYCVPNAPPGSDENKNSSPGL